MKKQRYILSIIAVSGLALVSASCSAPSTNTAANVSNKTNANYPMTNANTPMRSTNSNANTAMPTPTIK